MIVSAKWLNALMAKLEKMLSIAKAKVPGRGGKPVPESPQAAEPEPSGGAPKTPPARVPPELPPAEVFKHEVGSFLVETPEGSVEAIMYGGGYDPRTNSIGLGRFHGHGVELVTPEGVAPTGLAALEFPGITVTDIPSKGTLFWNNRSASLPRQLIPEQVRAVQTGLENAFPGRTVVFDPYNSQTRQFISALQRGDQ
jgi:hypothetical protein